VESAWSPACARGRCSHSQALEPHPTSGGSGPEGPCGTIWGPQPPPTFTTDGPRLTEERVGEGCGPKSSARRRSLSYTKRMCRRGCSVHDRPDGLRLEEARILSLWLHILICTTLQICTIDILISMQHHSRRLFLQDCNATEGPSFFWLQLMQMHYMGRPFGHCSCAGPPLQRREPAERESEFLTWVGFTG
jgi:hypothetical protein